MSSPRYKLLRAGVSFIPVSLIALTILSFTPTPGTAGEPITTDITIQSQGHALKGRFFQADTPPGGSVTFLLLPGFPGNPQDVLGLGNKLSALGVNVTIFNYSGTHQSEGEFGPTQTFSDIQAAWDYLHRSDVIAGFHIDTTRLVLGGYSYGGGMALAYAAGHPEVSRLVSIAGNDHGAFAREYLSNPEMARSLDSIFDALRRPKGPINFEGSTALRKLAANSDPLDLRLAAPHLASRDLLLVGGWDDQQVAIENNLLPFYRALKKAGANQVKFVAFPTNHSFRNVKDELAQQLKQWLTADSLIQTEQARH